MLKWLGGRWEKGCEAFVAMGSHWLSMQCVGDGKVEVLDYIGMCVFLGASGLVARTSLANWHIFMIYDVLAVFGVVLMNFRL